jgi:hypothetical protein
MLAFLIDYDNASRKYGSEFINIATRRSSPIITSASFLQTALSDILGYILCVNDECHSSQSPIC